MRPHPTACSHPKANLKATQCYPCFRVWIHEEAKRRTPERFWLQVNKGGPVPADAPHLGACWLWTGSKDRLGYGRFWDGAKRRKVLAHRWAYEDEHGHPMPRNLESDHLCRTPPCIRSSHIEAVPRSVNTLRGCLPAVQRARGRARTHCPHGHSYDKANTYIKPDGTGRDCKTCRAERSRSSRAWRREGAPNPL